MEGEGGVSCGELSDFSTNMFAVKQTYNAVGFISGGRGMFCPCLGFCFSFFSFFCLEITHLSFSASARLTIFVRVNGVGGGGGAVI